jgi:hypothetical protein
MTNPRATKAVDPGDRPAGHVAGRNAGIIYGLLAPGHIGRVSADMS